MHLYIYINQVVYKKFIFFQDKIFSNNLNETKNTESSYSILPITKNDIQTAISFLREVFFRDEPLNVAIQLLEETGSALQLEKYCISCLQYGKSLG